MQVMREHRRGLRNSLWGLRNKMKRMKLDDEHWQHRLLSPSGVSMEEAARRNEFKQRCDAIANLMAIIDLAESSAHSHRLLGETPAQLGCENGQWWLLLTAPQRKKYEELSRAYTIATNTVDITTGDRAKYDTASQRRAYNARKQREYRQRVKAQDAMLVEQMRAGAVAQERARIEAFRQAAGEAFDTEWANKEKQEKAEVIALKEQTPQDAVRVQADIEARIARGESLEGLLRPTPPEPALNPLGLKPSPGINKEAWAALMDAIEEDEE
jgi:hypothetical protein